MKIGLDLDNTLVCYDSAFLQVGREEGFLPASFAGDKVAIKRALLTQRPDGYLWEALQGLVYGRRIETAVLFDGAARFLELCREHPGVEVVVVSHKTELAHHDLRRTNLRTAALTWMENKGFFDPSALALDPQNVYFESTRDDKVRRIATIGCNLFVDDLSEVLAHPEMPAACRKLLFGRDRQSEFEQYATWHEICDAIFPSA